MLKYKVKKEGKKQGRGRQGEDEERIRWKQIYEVKLREHSIKIRKD